jgi:desulfoferrodoxin (superoxide reductase-like protein)
MLHSDLNNHYITFIEVKIKPEHMQGASELTVEPVTPEMAAKVGKPPKVEVTKSQKDI